MDQDDSTNLPMGLAALCKDFDFARDSGGPTCATTRAGINTSMQCVDPNAPVTGLLGFVYEPESATDPAFQLPMAFQPTAGSQYEKPVGTGHMVAFPPSNFQEPSLASLGISPHAIQASAGNKIFTAYSDLMKPLSSMSNIDPKAKTINIFGMKPFGFNWQPGLTVQAGEVCTPAAPLTGNGHTYQAQNAGVTAPTAALQPIWPLTEGGQVNDNGIVWVEKTMVIANRLPTPPAPTLALAGGGTIAADKDVYIVITLVNRQGETLPSIPVFITTIAGGSSVNVSIPALAALPGWVQNLPFLYVPYQAYVYVAIVAHGQPAPALSSYQFFVHIVNIDLGSVFTVTGLGSGVPPPTFNSARVTPGQLPTPTTEPPIQASPAGATVNPPGPPIVSLVDGAGGTWATGTPLYFWLTLVNANGETTVGPFTQITPTEAGQGIKISLAASYGPTVTGVNVYASISETPTEKATAGPYALGAAPVFVNAGGEFTSASAPATNTATLPAGLFPAGRDVYVAMTYTQENLFTSVLGETPLGPANSILNTNADDAILVGPLVEPLGPANEQLYTITSIGIYEADVPTGTAAPPPSAFALVGYFQPGDTPFITETATGPNPPITNTTGPGGAIAADTLTGGANGGQGYRYAAMGWINQMETFSGFTLASVVSTIIDEDGWQIGAFNVPLGMPNVVGRYIAFTVADGSQAGPFNYIGLVDLEQPSQNVVYPMQTLIDQVQQSATIFLDNTTTQGIFNFTDTYLIADNNVDDRLDVTIPPQGVRVDYLDSVSRLAVTGVPGLTSGVWISLADDPESFYGDTSPVPIAANGEKCYGVSDKYKGIIFALMEESGFTIDANTGDPSSWSAKRRWQGMGPCGFRAWDANGKFIIFAHRSGIYKYDMSDPDLMSKEIPKLWSSVNWEAGQTICVTIDEDTHTVRILVPTGDSTVPNQEFSLSYIEGWNNPIHFSTFSGREISMDAARRWSQNDVSAFICARLKRTLPPGGNAYIDGPSFETIPDSSFQLTQLLYASSGPDGTVQARTPGIFSDNGEGIDWAYETMSSGLMQAVCKPEGFNLNAAGSGICIPSFIASRAMESDEGGVVTLVQVEEEILMEPIPLSPKQIAGITRKCAPAVNEFWRERFRSDGQPGTWISLKAMTSYVIPFTVGRDDGDK